MTAAHEQESDPLLQFIERFASVLVAAGFPAMSARVFVVFLVSDSDRLTAADLAGTLRISPAAVSGAVRYLTGLGLLHKDRVPGSRRDYYRMPADVWHEVTRLQNQVLQRWTSLLKEGVDLVGAETPAGARMAEHSAFFEFLNAEIPTLLARWDALSGDLPAGPTCRMRIRPTLSGPNAHLAGSVPGRSAARSGCRRPARGG